MSAPYQITREFLDRLNREQAAREMEIAEWWAHLFAAGERYEAEQRARATRPIADVLRELKVRP